MENTFRFKLILLLSTLCLFGCPSPDDDPFVELNEIENELPDEDENNPDEEPIVFSFGDFQVSTKTATTLDFVGSLTGDRSVLQRMGLVYSTVDSSPTLVDAELTENVVFGLNGAFETQIENLEEATTYYVRVFLELPDNEIQYSETLVTRTVGWYRLANFPGPGRAHAGAFTIGDEGYMFCGSYAGASGGLALSDFWKYDNGTDTWTELDFGNCLSGRPFNNARNFRIVEVVDNTAYVGLYDFPTVETGGTSSALIRFFWSFQVSTGCWEPLPNFPEQIDQCFNCGSFALGDNIYVFGSEDSFLFNEFLYRFDTKALTWEKVLDDLPFSLSAYPFEGLTLNGISYVSAGGVLYQFNEDNLMFSLISSNTEPFGQIVGAFEFNNWLVFVDRKSRTVAYDPFNDEWFSIVNIPADDILGPIIFRFQENCIIGLGNQLAGITPRYFPHLYNLEK